MSKQDTLNRRDFLQKTALTALGAGSALQTAGALAQPKGDRPASAGDVTVLNPQNRVPMSFIIDDSTCLVNMAHFGIPHFATAWPDRYKQDWRSLPREIPDSFVRKFGQWCREHGIKGKYSIVPYPALVGWLDRCLPGWTQKELDDSLKLVRDFMLPDWDIHPEMITHTWVINTKTGRPYPEQTGYYIENAGWSQDKSADELADYMAYALRILKNVGLPCEGITTPGGFGGQNRPNLAQATLESCRDVQFITEDLEGGRLPEVIKKGEPAILVCHWPGVYFNGEEIGFNIFKEVIRRLEARYDNLIWMKNSEIARYWAARELTKIERQGRKITFNAPFATTRFTIRTKAGSQGAPTLIAGANRADLRRVTAPLQLKSQTWHADGAEVTACFDLPKGKSTLAL